MKPFFSWPLAAALLCAGSLRAAAPNAAVFGLVGRIVPGHERDFVVEEIPAPAGENVFEVEEIAGAGFVLRGDGPLSQAVAFNWYLRHDARVSVSWRPRDDAVMLPETLPLPAEKIRRTTRVRDRFFFNYCTFGYTTPFWRWRDWERCIDWMALNGINLPLAQNGNESVWQKVWRDYGLSDEEIRGYFTGPAHLLLAPDGDDIDGWDGPLPQSFIDGQRGLQRQILGRERELGMSPVLCAFAGHVLRRAPGPAARDENRPDSAGLGRILPRLRLLVPRSARSALPGDPGQIPAGAGPGVRHEPSVWDRSVQRDHAPELGAFLSGQRLPRVIYGGMAQADPDAVWMAKWGWTFTYQRAQWTDARFLSAMIGVVPPGRRWS